MSVARVYVAPKNSDLHAWSALETFHRYLNVPEVVGLRRIGVWELTLPDGESWDEQKLSALSKSLLSGRHLLNPNKERFWINGIGEMPSEEPVPTRYEAPQSHASPVGVRSSDGSIRYFVATVARSEVDYTRIAALVASDLKIRALHAKHCWMWDVSIRSDRNESELGTWLLDRVLNTTGHRKGLLVHPLLEQLSFQSPSEVLHPAFRV